MNSVFSLQVAGLLQFSLLAAGLALPRAVRMRETLAILPEFHRRLFWVYYVFTGIHFVGCGLITFVCADALSTGGVLARGFCTFLTVYWTARFAVTLFVFDVRPFLVTGLHRAGHYILNAVFVYLATVFAWVAVRPAP
jgi:hypothetical protein